VIEVRQTPAFAQWLAGLRDRAAVARINVRIRRRGPQTVVLLCGGDKSTQDRDIGRAKELAKEDRNGS
jgi:putative component of toxin-antitoxin plasmid stabilization module